MRKIRDVLRLTQDLHLNTRQVAPSLNISRSTVTNYQQRAEKAGLSWPLPEELTEEALEEKLFPPLVSVEAPGKALPDFDYIYRELKTHKKFNLTLDQLWREYREQSPGGYQYSQYCQLYRAYRSKLDYSMRQDHKGSEKLFVDYGEGLALIDPQTGDLIKTELFVSVWVRLGHLTFEQHSSLRKPQHRRLVSLASQCRSIPNFSITWHWRQ